jgi:hypothetical protein
MRLLEDDFQLRGCEHQQAGPVQELARIKSRRVDKPDRGVNASGSRINEGRRQFAGGTPPGTGLGRACIDCRDREEPRPASLPRA